MLLVQPLVRQATYPLEVHLQREAVLLALDCVVQLKRVAGEEVVEQIQRSAPIGEEEEEELRQRQELGVEHTAGMLIAHGTAGHHPQDETETEDHHPQVGRETERGTGREIATAQEVGLGLALEVGLVLHRGGPNVIDGLIVVNVQM